MEGQLWERKRQRHRAPFSSSISINSYAVIPLPRNSRAGTRSSGDVNRVGPGIEMSSVPHRFFLGCCPPRETFGASLTTPRVREMWAPRKPQEISPERRKSGWHAALPSIAQAKSLGGRGGSGETSSHAPVSLPVPPFLSPSDPLRQAAPIGMAAVHRRATVGPGAGPEALWGPAEEPTGIDRALLIDTATSLGRWRPHDDADDDGSAKQVYVKDDDCVGE